jgi:hypothetical protein
LTAIQVLPIIDKVQPSVKPFVEAVPCACPQY